MLAYMHLSLQHIDNTAQIAIRSRPISTAKYALLLNVEKIVVLKVFYYPCWGDPLQICWWAFYGGAKNFHLGVICPGV